MKEKNQCEVCQRGIYLANGFHISDMMESKTRCTKDRYDSPTTQEGTGFNLHAMNRGSQPFTDVRREKNIKDETETDLDNLESSLHETNSFLESKRDMHDERKGCQCGCEGGPNNPFCQRNHCSDECRDYRVDLESYPCCKDCGLPDMHNVDHACDEKGKAKLAEPQEKAIKTVGRLDDSCKDGCVHSPVSSDWKKTETDAWIEMVPKGKIWEALYLNILEYWLSRIQTLIQEEVARVDNSGKRLYQIGYDAALVHIKDACALAEMDGEKKERERLIALAEGMKDWSSPTMSNYGSWEDKGYQKALSDLIDKIKG